MRWFRIRKRRREAEQRRLREKAQREIAQRYGALAVISLRSTPRS